MFPQPQVKVKAQLDTCQPVGSSEWRARASGCPPPPPPPKQQLTLKGHTLRVCPSKTAWKFFCSEARAANDPCPPRPRASGSGRPLAERQPWTSGPEVPSRPRPDGFSTDPVNDDMAFMSIGEPRIPSPVLLVARRVPLGEQ